MHLISILKTLTRPAEDGACMFAGYGMQLRLGGWTAKQQLSWQVDEVRMDGQSCGMGPLVYMLPNISL